MSRECLTCNVVKTFDEFYAAKTKLGVGSRCKECAKAYYRAHEARYKANLKNRRTEAPYLRREYDLKRKYGIDWNTYMTMVEQQTNRCAICRVHENDLKVALSVDHNHSTGAVRELLCSSCNYVLGLIKENKYTAQRVVAYLEKHERPIEYIIVDKKEVIKNVHEK